MIKAIETEYKGYRFRSRLEARWAVFFDVRGMAWEYEKQGYELKGIDGVTHFYLPDFYLPGLGFFEVKGEAPTKTEISKAELLTSHTDQICIIASNGIGCSKENELHVIAHIHNGKEKEHYACYIQHSYFVWTPDAKTVEAVNKARSARFEHGESPNL